ncbi:hypothetical protein F5X96DRAFT_402474 [Biscogniauxia mediterranea]|nr:hypothetical protein F5X96DRAFT_402474 [Biscogniauxia mediterranea]
MITLPGPLDKLPSIRNLASLLFLLANALVLTRDSFPQNQNQRTIIMDNPRRAPLLLTTPTPNLENPLQHHHHHRARRARRAARLRSAVVASGSTGISPPPPPLRGAASTRRHMVALARAYRAARTTRPQPIGGGGKEEQGEQEEEEYCFAVEEEERSEKEKKEKENGFEKAMARMREELVGRGPLTLTADDGLLPPRREDGRAGLLENGKGKKVRGAGWHRRGYRDQDGCMWINVKEGTYGPVRGREASERETMRGFVRGVFDSHASTTTDCAGGYADLLFRKKSLVRMLVDLENRGLPDEEALVCDYFDGGETVYFKVYDKEGVECSPY